MYDNDCVKKKYNIWEIVIVSLQNTMVRYVPAGLCLNAGF